MSMLVISKSARQAEQILLSGQEVNASPITDPSISSILLKIIVHFRKPIKYFWNYKSLIKK